MNDYSYANELEQQAKAVLGDKAAEIIASDLKLEKWDGHKGCSPFREERTPSFIWNPKENCFKDFSSGRTYGMIDHYMSFHNMNYFQALKSLCELVDIAVDEDSLPKGKKYKKAVLASEEPENDRSVVEKYLSLRGISKKTLDFCDVKQSGNGNIAFQHKDEYGTLISTKYRISHKQKKDELKWYWQKGNTIHDILYGVNRIKPHQQLVICEGNCDRLSIVEAGYPNVVSIPNGAESDKWIDYNFDFLEQFDDIVLWFDNDQAGEDGRKKVASRLGEYRVKLVNPDETVVSSVKDYYIPYGADIDKTDANNVLLACGPETVLRLIKEAEIIENPRLKDLFSYDPIDVQTLPKVTTGFKALDKIVTGNFDGNLVVLSGFSGCVDCDTEYFNGHGWKRIADFVPGDRVLQYTKDGTAELVYPNAYIRNKAEKLNRFRTKFLDQCLSDEHNVVYVTSKGNLASKKMSEIKKQHLDSKVGFSGKFIYNFKYSGCGVDISDSRIREAINSTEHFSSEWYNFTERQLDVFSNEIMESRIKYSVAYITDNKDDADFVQFSLTASGVVSKIKHILGAYAVVLPRPKQVAKKKVQIEDYPTKDGYEYCFNVPSSMLVLRRNGKIFITGNSGKTTLIAEMGIIAPLEAGKKVMVFSGEANGGVLLGNTYRPLAGRNNIIEWDNSDKGLPNGYSVTTEAMNCIKEFYKGQVYNYDDGEEILTTASEILNQMEYAYKRFGVTHFTLDNLMCISCVSDDEDEKYESQYKFTLALKRFTRKYGTTVFLVAHAKKPAPGQKVVDMYSVSGASEIVNLADRGFSVSRLYDDPGGFGSAIYVMKDRVEGRVGTFVKLKFDKPTMRLYSDADELYKKRRWEENFHPEYPANILSKLVGHRDLDAEKLGDNF